MFGRGDLLPSKETARCPSLARLLGLVLFSMQLSHTVRADEVTLSTAATGNYSVHLMSYAEIPFRTVIRQQYDYSCGSAALATVLRYQYGKNVDEGVVFKAMYAVGDQDRIQKLGFSLLDMKKYLSSIGYVADGYQISLKDLQEAAVPAIALIQIGSYKHFVVIKGVVGDRVLIGDPAQGLRSYSSNEFKKFWNGIAFLIHEQPATDPNPVFNSANEWQRWADSHPLTAATVIQPMTPFLRDLRVIYQVRLNNDLPSPFVH
jgi:predicted double-glycine peptidase